MDEGDGRGGLILLTGFYRGRQEQFNKDDSLTDIIVIKLLRKENNHFRDIFFSFKDAQNVKSKTTRTTKGNAAEKLFTPYPLKQMLAIPVSQS